MNKILSISIGVLVGIAAFSAMLLGDFIDLTAHGQISRSDFEERIVTRDLEWSDIFGPSEDGYDLYMMVHGNLNVMPERDALRNVAQKYGLTIDEAEAAANGSITAIYNNPSKDFNNLTIEQAFNESLGIQADFEELLELYSLQEAFDAYTAPSEIFANADLADSGFDLIHDLDTIETILFNESTGLSVSGDFFGEVDNLSKELGPNGGPSAVITNVDLGEESDDNNAIDGENSDEGEGDEIDLLIRDVENIIEKETYLEEDICVDPSGLSDALSNYEEEKSENDNDAIVANIADTADDEDDLLDGVNAEENLNVDEESYSLYGEDLQVEPAPAGNWAASWCPNMVPSSSRAGKGYVDVIGQNGFNSLANVAESLVNQTLSAGAAVGIGGENTSLTVGICLTTEFVYATYTSYVAGDSCIQCEVEKINDLLDETLSHSLIPNKVTGNYLESAKCKDAFEPLPDMKIIAIPAPILTPPNYDMIADKNIFEEWNTFVEKYRPFLSNAGTIGIDMDSEFVLQNSSNSGIEQTLIDINTIKSNALADAQLEIDNMDFANDATNVSSYSQAVFAEIKEMKNLFISLDKLFTDIDVNACRAIKEKPSI